MKKHWKELAKGTALATLAIGIGVGIALADADDSYYSTGNSGTNQTGGDLAVVAGDSETGHLSVVGNVSITTSTASQGSLNMAGGATNTDDLIIYRDFLGSSGTDIVNFGVGSEAVVYGLPAQDYNGILSFEYSLPRANDDDGLYYWAGTDVDDDLLEIAGDDVQITANNGDVVIQLGY